jgi:hypothetical protein
VEVDIHSGLLETLDIQWRDQFFSQRLDYLGLPFCCTLCQKTGHLRNSCQGYVEEEESENSRLRKMPRSDSPEFISTTREVPCPVSSDSPNDSGSDTLTGKLKVHCPSFFNSLTSWEKLVLDASSQPGAESVFTPCDPVPISLTVTTSLENHLTSGLGSCPWVTLPFSGGSQVFLHGSVRAHSTWSEPRVCFSASVSPSFDVGVSIPDSQALHEISRVGEDLGGTEPYLISGYREDDPGDCSLGETLESLVPLFGRSTPQCRS